MPTPAERAHAAHAEHATHLLKALKWQIAVHTARARCRDSWAMAGDMSAATEYIALALARLGDSRAAAHLGLAGLPKLPDTTR
jgi:hypothetical protein